MNLIDTHCHIDFSEFDQDRVDIIGRAKELGVQTIVVPGVAQSRWDCLLEVCRQHLTLKYALGLHPVFINEHTDEHIDLLGEYVKKYQPLAVGEIGLDYFEKDLDPKKQLSLFEAQLRVAADASLPVILHVRKAHDDVIKLLKKHNIESGIVHAFNGSLQQAEKYQALGCKLGFGGMLTFERSTKLRKLAQELPLSSIVLETDAPDMTVSQHRGERNSPTYLVYILNALAEVKQLDVETISDQTTENAKQVLNIK